jgi:hypothetical protein
LARIAAHCTLPSLGRQRLRPRSVRNQRHAF